VSVILDTNVLCEAGRKEPNGKVLGWIAAQALETVFISAITLAELRRGALGLTEGKKRKALLHWLRTAIKEGFAGRILPVDTIVAERWAELQVATSRRGRTLPVMDSLIAATALAHGFVLATRNVRDFQAAGLALVNPWE